MNNLFGAAVVLLGVVLLVMGISAADSVGSSFSRLFTGHPTDKSIWLIVGGIVCILSGAGGFMFFRGSSDRS